MNYLGRHFSINYSTGGQNLAGKFRFYDLSLNEALLLVEDNLLQLLQVLEQVELNSEKEDIEEHSRGGNLPVSGIMRGDVLLYHEKNDDDHDELNDDHQQGPQIEALLELVKNLVNDDTQSQCRNGLQTTLQRVVQQTIRRSQHRSDVNI